MTWTRVSATALACLLAAPAYAVHDDGVFQLDGDAKAATCGNSFPNNAATCTGDDWDSLYTCSAGGGLGCTPAAPGVNNHAAAISALVVDPAPASIFTGGGSKDENDLTQWQWKNGSVPDKDDLVESFAALYLPTAGALANKKVIYFGANRLAVNGDAQIGFWFFQNAVSPKSDGTFQNAQGGPAHHAVGDVLILSNFVQGGGQSNIQVYKVNLVNQTASNVNCPAGSVETFAGPGAVCLAPIVSGTANSNGVCNISTPGFPDDVACAATNGSAVPSLDPDFTPKGGVAGTYPTVGFFEGGLNLTDAGLGQECFPTFVVETRSSQSVTAVLKDFTIGAFEQCSAGITTEIHSSADNTDSDLQGTSVNPNTSFHDVAIVNGTQGAPLPTGSVTFTRWYNLTTAPACAAGTGTTVVTEDILLTSPTTCPASAPAGAICVSTSSLSVSGASPGFYSYKATYNGDSNYNPVTSNCEPLTVNKLNSSVTTHIYTVDSQGNLLTEKTDNFIDLAGSATVSVRDQAIVGKDPAPAAGDPAPPTPTGTVTFTQYQYSNCTGSTTTQDVTLGTCVPSGSNASGTASACSSTFSLGPPTPTLGYKVTYGGDSNYNASSASRCEPVCSIDTTQ